MVIRRRTRDNRAYRTEVVWRMIRPQDVRARDAQSDFTTGQRQGLGATLNAQPGDQVLVLLVLQIYFLSTFASFIGGAHFSQYGEFQSYKYYVGIVNRLGFFNQFEKKTSFTLKICEKVFG